MWRADEIQDNVDPIIINLGEDSSSAETRARARRAVTMAAATVMMQWTAYSLSRNQIWYVLCMLV
jgi:hypothetical protein